MITIRRQLLFRNKLTVKVKFDKLYDDIFDYFREKEIKLFMFITL